MILKKYQYDLDNLYGYRSLRNYKVIDFPNEKNNICVVFFSSNGLYYPNVESILDSVIEKDRYEWGGIIRSGYKRIVYLRDIYKQWYCEGISNDVNTPAKLNNLLKSLCDGFETIFVGSSAGGYAAIYHGNLLKVEKVICFSAQFDITAEARDSVRNKLLNENKYHMPFILDEFITKVIYFLPANSVIDIEQFGKIKSKKNNILCVQVNSDIHGVPIFTFALRNLLKLDLDDFQQLSSSLQSKYILSYKYLSWPDFFVFVKNKCKIFFRVFGR